MSGVSQTERFETIVIGGGQAGLAAGYHLARRGLPFVILERGRRVGDQWRERWDSLRLYSPARADGLPGMRFPASAYHYPTGREMADYLEGYAAAFDLPVRTGVAVDGLARAEGGDGYVVSAGNERFEASQVIVASGAFQRPYVPDFAAELDPAIRQLHSSEYRNPSQLQDGAVLVVGVSHSGGDIAFETARSHPTILSGRAHGQLPFAVIDTPRARIVWPIVAFLANHLLTMRTPIGRKMAPKVRAGGGPLLRIRRPDLLGAGVRWLEARTVGVRDGRPMLADGQVLDVATVIWCTGFRPDYGWIALPILGDDGWPRQSRGVVDSAPGLYFAGVPFQYAFASMLVLGAGRDAKYVVERIAARSRAAQTERKLEAVATP